MDKRITFEFGDVLVSISENTTISIQKDYKLSSSEIYHLKLELYFNKEPYYSDYERFDTMYDLENRYDELKNLIM